MILAIQGILGTLDFRPVVPAGYIVMLALAGAAILIYITARQKRTMRTAQYTGLFALRGLFLCSLLLLLANPGRVVPYQPEEEKTTVIWLMDRSGSMAVADVDTKSRFESACRLAAPYLVDSRGPLLHRVFLFDADVSETDAAKLDSNGPTGAATDIPGCIERAVRSVPSSARLPIVFLVSDGIQTVETDLLRSLALAAARRTKIYAIPLGGDVEAPDLSVRVLGGRKVSFVGNPIIIEVELSFKFLPPSKASVRLLATRDGKGPDELVEQKQFDLAGTGRQVVGFQVSNDAPGLYRYLVEAESLQTEFNRQNNRDEAHVINLKEKMKILLVEGNPYWETKYLVQLFRKDPSIDVKAVFMLAPGRVFEVDEVADGAVRAGPLEFPKTIEELQKYNVVILGQDVRFLIDAKGVALLESFLFDCGGAVLFARGKPYSGEFPELARLEPLFWGEALSDESRRLVPSELGLQLPLFQYELDEPTAETMKALPGVSPRYRVEQLKSFAEVLADTVVGQHESPVPALIVRKMGKGIVATVNAEGLWRWDFMPGRLKKYHDVYTTFWGQLVRWIALRSDFLPGEDVSFRSSGSIFRPAQLIQFTVAQRFQGDKPLRPNIRLVRDGTLCRTLVPSKSRANAGVWHAMCSLDDPGNYDARLFDGETALEKMSLRLAVKHRAIESSALSADPEYLKTLARQTGGRLIKPDEIKDIIAGIVQEQAPQTAERRQWRLSWDSLSFLLLAVCFASLEWAWRRRSGLL